MFLQVLVFCTTAMLTRLVADLLSKFNLNVREIHSRKTQSYRTRVSDEFRKSKGLILVTSDVSARGVDYPDVTLVIQVNCWCVLIFLSHESWISFIFEWSYEVSVWRDYINCSIYLSVVPPPNKKSEKFNFIFLEEASYAAGHFFIPNLYIQDCTYGKCFFSRLPLFEETISAIYRWVCQLVKSSTYTDLVEQVGKANKARAYCYYHLGRNSFCLLLRICQ